MAKKRRRDPEQEQFDEASRRIVDAQRDPAVFDEIMAENRRLNAAEEAARQTTPEDLQTVRELAADYRLDGETISPRVDGVDLRAQQQGVDHLLEEIGDEQREIQGHEAIGPEAAEAWFDRRLGDEHDVSERYVDADAELTLHEPALHYDAQTVSDYEHATDEERQRWGHQERDPGHVPGNQATAAAANAAYAKMTDPVEQTFPPLSAAQKQLIIDAIRPSLESLQRLMEQVQEPEE